MHTYRKTAGDTFEVGYYAPDYRFITEDDAVATGTWQTLSTHFTEQDAIRRVNFLNGGSST